MAKVLTFYGCSESISLKNAADSIAAMLHSSIEDDGAYIKSRNDIQSQLVELAGSAEAELTRQQIVSFGADVGLDIVFRDLCAELAIMDSSSEPKPFASNKTDTVTDDKAFEYGLARVALQRLGVSDAEINWEHWRSLPIWTPEQAVWLIYNIDPDMVAKPIQDLPVCEYLRGLRGLLRLAQSRGDMTPSKWKQFGVEQELQWSMPRQLREIQEPVIEAVNVKLLSERLNKHLSHLEIVSLWIDTKGHRNVTNHHRETIHQAFLDEESVLYDEKLIKAIKDNHELKDRNLKAINQAIADGDLKAEISVSHSGRVGSWEVIPHSPTMLHGVQGDTGVYQGRGVYVQHMINRDDFRAWLEKAHQWPIPDDCLLSQWFEAEIYAEAGIDNSSRKKKKTSLNERELKQGLREIWEKEKRPEMKAYFPTLKKYVNKPGSPILEHFTAGNDAGIRYRTSCGTTGYLKKKTISNYVTQFKKTP